MNQNHKKVNIQTFGCQMNKLDSEILVNALKPSGFEFVNEQESADIILFNTCSVRKHAEDRVYSRIGALKHLKKRKPALVIGVVGCMAQKDGPEIIERFPQVSIVSGTGSYSALVNALKQLDGAATDKIVLTDFSDNAGIDSDINRSTFAESPFSAYLKVIKGCACKCSYCIVPYVRGREMSRPPAEILEEAVRLTENGIKEITLLGQNITRYGADMNDKEITLSRLLVKMHDINGLQRIKYVTSHPSFMTEELLEVTAGLPKICDYIHMPAQSGSNRILKAMRRGYTREKYLALVEKGKKLSEFIEFVSDFIVGYPGETEEDFLETVALVKDARLQNSFIFKYSPRPGAPSFEIEDTIPHEIKKERNRVLLSVQEEISREKNRALHGKELDVFVEGQSRLDKSNQTGRTSSNHIVVFSSEKDYSGKFVRVRITDSTPLTLFADLLSETANA